MQRAASGSPRPVTAARSFYSRAQGERRAPAAFHRAYAQGASVEGDTRGGGAAARRLQARVAWGGEVPRVLWLLILRGRGVRRHRGVHAAHAHLVRREAREEVLPLACGAAQIMHVS